MLLLCTTFLYGDESEEIDLTNGKFFKGISINTNTTTLAYLLAKTLNGDNPLLKIVRHKSYLNGFSVDYQYVKEGKLDIYIEKIECPVCGKTCQTHDSKE